MVLKLTKEQADEIKALLRKGNLSEQQIADRCGITYKNVSHIKTGRIWNENRKYAFQTKTGKGVGKKYIPTGNKRGEFDINYAIVFSEYKSKLENFLTFLKSKHRVGQNITIDDIYMLEKYMRED